MKETGIDMWIIITREYNEDPIIKTFLPPTWLNARRRTILVFYHNSISDKVEAAAISRYNFGENIPSIWNKEKTPNQFEALYNYISEKAPNKIGLNFSENFWPKAFSTPSFPYIKPRRPPQVAVGLSESHPDKVPIFIVSFKCIFIKFIFIIYFIRFFIFFINIYFTESAYKIIILDCFIYSNWLVNILI